MRVLVLTAISGRKDTLRDPGEIYENCDYIAYVDQVFEGISVWRQKKLFEFSRLDQYNHRRNAKYPKILASNLYPQYDYIVWVDGTKALNADPIQIISKNPDADIHLFKHPLRDCAYAEAEEVAKLKLDNIITLADQFRFYQRSGMPHKYNLYELPTFIRKSTEVTKMMEMMWWEQICKYSSRDQISLPYVLWQLEDKIKINILEGFASTYFGHFPENKYFKDYGQHNY